MNTIKYVLDEDLEDLLRSIFGIRKDVTNHEVLESLRNESMTSWRVFRRMQEDGILALTKSVDGGGGIREPLSYNCQQQLIVLSKMIREKIDAGEPGAKDISSYTEDSFDDYYDEYLRRSKRQQEPKAVTTVESSRNESNERKSTLEKSDAPSTPSTVKSTITIARDSASPRQERKSILEESDVPGTPSTVKSTITITRDSKSPRREEHVNMFEEYYDRYLRDKQEDVASTTTTGASAASISLPPLTSAPTRTIETDAEKETETAGDTTDWIVEGSHDEDGTCNKPSGEDDTEPADEGEGVGAPPHAIDNATSSESTFSTVDSTESERTSENKSFGDKVRELSIVTGGTKKTEKEPDPEMILASIENYIAAVKPLCRGNDGGAEKNDEKKDSFEHFYEFTDSDSEDSAPKDAIAHEKVSLSTSTAPLVDEDPAWEQKFQLLVKYEKQCRTTLVSRISPLYPWVKAQRLDYQQNKLSDNRVQRLKSIDFVFDETQVWEDYFQLFVSYQSKHKTSQVPIDDPTLGDWVNQQRVYYKQKKLTEYELQRLESTGFVFDANTARWMEMYNKVLSYKEQHGNLLDIPQTSTDTRDGRLGHWVYTQREHYLRGILSENRISLLESIGFQWHSEDMAAWMAMYQRLEEYKTNYQNGLATPKDKVDEPLARWVHAQRQSCKEPGRIAMLNAIGFDWEIKHRDEPHRDDWRSMYERLVAYKEEHGTTVVSYNEDKDLAGWVHRQRRSCSDAEKMNLLNDIGFIWNRRNSPTVINRKRLPKQSSGRNRKNKEKDLGRPNLHSDLKHGSSHI